MASQVIPLCDPYVWEDPRYLFRPFWITRQHDRSRGVCASELINHSIGVYIVAILIGMALSSYGKISSAPLIMGLFATVYLYPTFTKLRQVEGFRINFVGSETITSDSEDPDKLLEQVKEEVVEEGFNTLKTSGNPRNPFNNVLIDEIAYAPTRPEAPDITTHKSKIALDDFFRVQWYSDPTDVFGKSQSQREFVTQPSTTIPNDQGSYQEWLYKIPGKTCKEGNASACYGGTNGGLVPWLNH